jgi:TRAP-type uncharacterized transport system fused permease subunit
VKSRRSFLIPIFLLAFLLVLTSCAPSTSAIQTADAQTLTAAPTDTAAPPFPPNAELPPDAFILITPDFFETVTEPPENPELPTTPNYSGPAIATLAEPKEPYPTPALTSKDFQPVGHTFENGFLLIAVMIVLAFFMWLNEKDKLR